MGIVKEKGLFKLNKQKKEEIIKVEKKPKTTGEMILFRARQYYYKYYSKTKEYLEKTKENKLKGLTYKRNK